MKRLIAIIFVVSALMVAFLGGSAWAASVMDKDVVIVGTSGSYPPFEFHDKTGALVGYDIDLANEICRRMGKKAKWVDMNFDGLIPSLVANKIDMIAGALSITEARAKRINFTIPYMVSYSSFLVPMDSDIDSLDALKGLAVGVQLGTTQDVFLSGLKEISVKRFAKLEDAIREVALGRADASFMEKSVAENHIKSKEYEGKFKIAFSEKLEGAEQALGVRKGDPAFLEALNEAMQSMKDDGFIDGLDEKWRK